jgi:4-amino-4-deoxy-L-arabinose transferase-like glycosyltransferase
VSKKIPLLLLAILTVAFIQFHSSFFAFFTHDDFFLLNISRANSLKQFLMFFDPIHSPRGLGMYRPLAMQSFYLLAWKIFDLNPFGMHLISFLTFFVIIYLVYKLAFLLFGNRNLGLIASFLYATSATHFVHLYFLGVYQELLMTAFFLALIILYADYLQKGKLKYYLLAFISFLLSLLSKETAVVAPLVFAIVYFYLKHKDRVKISTKKFVHSLVPLALLLSVYFYIRFTYFGFPQGDSYVWQVSPRLLNTLFWYVAWSFAIPEYLIDFVGPGFKINFLQLKYWMPYLIPLAILVLIQIGIVSWLVVGKITKKSKQTYRLLAFCLAWFMATLLPVLFLPLHKFTYYLTLPLVGVSFAIAFLLLGSKKRLLTGVFLVFWFFSNLITTNLTSKTHWVVGGATASKNLFDYLTLNNITSGELVFYNRSEDLNLGWSPVDSLKNILSDNDFFEVFFPGIRVKYLESPSDINQTGVLLRARDFLNF